MSWPPLGGRTVLLSAALTVYPILHSSRTKKPLPPPYPDHPPPHHSVTLFAKDRGLFPRYYGDAAQEKCKGKEGGGTESGGDGSRGKHVQPSVLELACLKTSQGRDERMRERSGGAFVQTPLPMGACASV